VGPARAFDVDFGDRLSIFTGDNGLAEAKEDGRSVPASTEPTVAPKPKGLKKGEKRTRKQMAYVGAVYSIAPFKRTAEDVVNELRRKQRQADRPRPKQATLRRDDAFPRGRDNQWTSALFCPPGVVGHLPCKLGDDASLPDGRTAVALGAAFCRSTVDSNGCKTEQHASSILSHGLPSPKQNAR